MKLQWTGCMASRGRLIDTGGLLVLAILPLIAIVAGGCSGNRTFHEYVRAGDTVVVAAGWKQSFRRDNLTVTITPEAGAPVIYQPGNPSVRAVVNLYADPLSSMVVSRETGIDQTPYANTYAMTTGSNTGGDKDWWQTVVFVDLPDSLPRGMATIRVASSQGEFATSTFDVVDGAGHANSFSANLTGPLNSYMRDSLLRVNHYTVEFDGQVLPYSIQIEFDHDADRANGGVGSAFVVNPLGYIKNAAWSDNGFITRVLLTPASTASITSFSDFKFYVAGDVTNLSTANLQAFDVDGNPVAGVTSTLKYYD